MWQPKRMSWQEMSASALHVTDERGSPPALALSRRWRQSFVERRCENCLLGGGRRDCRMHTAESFEPGRRLRAGFAARTAKLYCSATTSSRAALLQPQAAEPLAPAAASGPPPTPLSKRYSILEKPVDADSYVGHCTVQVYINNFPQ